MGSADDRRFEVLRAIVADFVSTKEPIGSKTLVERHNLGVSSATVRNDMAVLEAEGYITQPHTSSGRVPTEKGYREFVDRLDDIKPLSSSERRAILSFLESGVDLDDVLRRAVRLLAQLTRQVAVVQYPTLSTSNVRHLEVVALTPAKLLLVVITDSGRVDQRTVELGDAIDEHQLSQLRERLAQALEGKPLAAASIAVSDLAAHLDGSGGLGANYTISNLTLSSTQPSNSYGLFPFIGSSGVVTNLTLADVTITAGAHTQAIGSLAGQNDGTIHNVQVINNWTDGTVTAEMDLLTFVPVMYRFRLPP